MTDASTVAVIIPIRNRPDLLRECLKSLAEQASPPGLSQVLICDDGSTEDLQPVMEEFAGRLPGLRLLRQSPKGPAAARNLGFRSCDAEILVCVDSDVVCGEGFLSKLVSALDEHTDWVAAEGTVLPIGTRGLLFDAPSSRGGAYLSCATAYRAEALRKAGGFDETFPLPCCEDIDLAAILLSLGTYGYVPDAVIYHPTRRVTWRTYWNWHRFWRYVMILAKRYGFLAFPERKVGRFPRLRVALAAVITLPGGRLLNGIRHMKLHPREGFVASCYALFDVLCGICALSDIFFAPALPRKKYLNK